jgi:hypothetical protein
MKSPFKFNVKQRDDERETAKFRGGSPNGFNEHNGNIFVKNVNAVRRFLVELGNS